jgi:hypothetical protein
MGGAYVTRGGKKNTYTIWLGARKKETTLYPLA